MMPSQPHPLSPIEQCYTLHVALPAAACMHPCLLFLQFAHLAKLRGSRITVNGSKIVRLLGGSATIDAGNVEQFLPGTLHGLQRTGVARATSSTVV